MGKIPSKLSNSVILRYLGLTSIFFIVIQLALGAVQVRWNHADRLAHLEQKVEDTAKFLAVIDRETNLEINDLTSKKPVSMPISPMVLSSMPKEKFLVALLTKKCQRSQQR
jgi:hypothetical protein